MWQFDGKWSVTMSCNLVTHACVQHYHRHWQVVVICTYTVVQGLMPSICYLQCELWPCKVLLV